ncbi:MAG TPA: hypothetical protein VF933_12450 [Streptosporangiaceae bacterium]
MYQPYPTDGAEPATQAPERPPSIQNAVWLMYAGAAVSAFVIIVALVTIGSTRSAIHADFPAYSASRVHKAAVALVVYEVVIQVITIGLWLWMAAANKAGKSWARIVSSVLFGLNTLILISSLARPHAAIGIVLLVLVWLVGLGAIVMLWRRDSTTYFAASKAR